jgi:hypothetical protein
VRSLQFPVPCSTGSQFKRVPVSDELELGTRNGGNLELGTRDSSDVRML